MTNLKLMLIAILTISLASCGRNTEKKKTAISAKSNSINISSIKTDTATRGKKINNSTTLSPVSEKSEIKTMLSTQKNTDVKKQKKVATITKAPEFAADDTFGPLRQILKISEIGKPLTKKELIETYNIPEEAVRLIKSVTKITKNEIYIEWRSTWAIEKISDARFEDAKIKFTFNNDKLLTSGNAIGIMHDKKLYTNLTIKGNKAYIPNVKGYSWQIGKS